MAVKNFDIREGLTPLDSVRLSENFTLQELYDASFMTPNEWLSATHIPFDSRLVLISQAIRDKVGHEVYWNSAFRSLAYDESKGRKNTRKTHSRGLAVDVSGSGVVELLERSFNAKDEFFMSLVAMGLSSIGFYDTFVHIDVDTPKADGSIRTWSFKKKKRV